MYVLAGVQLYLSLGTGSGVVAVSPAMKAGQGPPVLVRV